MTNNITAAQTAARDGAELGSLRARLNNAALSRREAQYRAEALALSAEYKRLKDAGRIEEAKQVRQQGQALIEAHYGTKM